MTAMPLLKRMKQAPWFRKMTAIVIAEYLRLVWKTSRCIIEPADFYERVAPDVKTALPTTEHFLPVLFTAGASGFAGA